VHLNLYVSDGKQEDVRFWTEFNVIKDYETTKFSMLIKFQTMTLYGAVDTNRYTFMHVTLLLRLTGPIVLRTELRIFMKRGMNILLQGKPTRLYPIVSCHL
jgi:hypothetical protein